MKHWQKNPMSLIRKALLVDAVIFGAAGALWWFRGEHNAIRLCNILFVLGGIAVFMGSFFPTGVKEGSVCYPYQSSPPAGPAKQQDPRKQESGYPGTRQFDFTVFFVAGMVAIGVGVVLYFFCRPMK